MSFPCLSCRNKGTLWQSDLLKVMQSVDIPSLDSSLTKSSYAIGDIITVAKCNEHLTCTRCCAEHSKHIIQFLQQPHEEVIIIPILQMRKWSLREVKSFTQGCTLIKWQRIRIQTLVSLTPKTSL